MVYAKGDGMKVLKIGSYLSLMAIAGVGVVMAITNPGQDAYEDYAVEQLSTQLNKRVCNEAPALLNNVCISVLAENQDWIRTLVADGTRRQNFILASIYTTDLSANDVLDNVLPANLSLSVDNLPNYHFETVGLFRTFYTYKTTQN